MRLFLDFTSYPEMKIYTIADCVLHINNFHFWDSESKTTDKLITFIWYCILITSKQVIS